MELGRPVQAVGGGSGRARRITFLRPVHVRPLGQTGPMKRMFAGNLSRGGMYIRSPAAFPPGTAVEVFLEARGQVLRFADAVVAFALPRDQASSRGRLPGFGLRFTRLPPRSRALVDHLLRLIPEPTPESARPRRGAIARPAAEAPRARRGLLAAALALALGGASLAATWAHFAGWLVR